LERIGLFGGTFNPIHLGHLRSALEIKEGFDLDKMFFIPAALPPHKQSEGVENATDRLEMIRLGIAHSSDLGVSDIELKRSGPSYTIDTIHHFRSISSDDTELFFVVGSDAFLELNTWKSYKELLQLIPFIVMVRPDSECNDINIKIEHLKDFLTSKVSRDFAYIAADTCYAHPNMPSVYIQNVTPLGISSTKIRESIHSGRSIQFLVPKAVEEYIKTKGLYK